MYNSSMEEIQNNSQEQLTQPSFCSSTSSAKDERAFIVNNPCSISIAHMAEEVMQLELLVQRQRVLICEHYMLTLMLNKMEFDEAYKKMEELQRKFESVNMGPLMYLHTGVPNRNIHPYES